MAVLRSELLMALWEKEDAAKQQQPAAAAVGPVGVPPSPHAAAIVLCCPSQCRLTSGLTLPHSPYGRALAPASVSHTSAAPHMQQCLLISQALLPDSCTGAHSRPCVRTVHALLRCIFANQRHGTPLVAQPCRLLACVLPHRRLR